MSRRPELPEDLQRLGSHLERAAAASMRRHARRQAVMNAVGAIAIAVPLAVAVAATDLNSSDGLVAQRTSSSLSDAGSPFTVRPVAYEVPVPNPQRCLDVKNCWMPQLREPAPAGRL
jgi:hypothetical protein